ncbi:zinc finger and SCAN domain-containing protein 2-like [Eupeodes corollae]|uniref:zinc finger and SCAN domain-containing protein 2-like n=1 Tax=Eupeodes corollae TaxID=290404 RepID=UPI00248F920B|nr:zinc finger and SCAN domain-containing protein 2-like [Eupeodes corollae]
MESTIICRACLNEISRQYISLDTPLNDTTVLEVFNYCTKLRANLNDDFPTNICIPCGRSLQAAYDFIKTAYETDQILRGCAGHTTEKEDLPPQQENISQNEEDDNIHQDLKEIQYESDRDYTEEYIEEIDNIKLENEEPQYVVLSAKEEVNVELIEEDGQQSYIESFTEAEVPEESFDLQKDESTNEANDSSSTNEKLYIHGEFVEDFEDVHYEDENDERNLKLNEPKEENSSQEIYDADESSNKKHAKQTPLKTWCCEVCGKFFSSKQKLAAHNLVHTKEKNFPCSLCPKRHATIFRHRDHMKTHENIRNHECEYCHERFFSKSTLICHLRRHTGERPYKCEICGKSFTQASIMKTHAALHTGKTVECNLCSKKFTRPSHLILHRRSHTGERPYLCTHCPNRYRQKSHLDRHLDTHMGVKHTCEICGKNYTKKSSLNTHRFVHMSTKQFKCGECGLEFSTKDRYNRHMKNMHKSTKMKENSRNENEVL